MALVSEQMLFEQGHDCDNPRLAASAKGVKLDIGRDEGGGELGGRRVR